MQLNSRISKFEFRMKNSESSEPPDSEFEIRNSKFEIHWPRLYAAVLAELALTILIFYLFTKAFS